MKTKASSKVRVGITLDETVVSEIKKLSKETVRSFSQYINYILAKHIKTVSETEVKGCKTHQTDI